MVYVLKPSETERPIRRRVRTRTTERETKGFFLLPESARSEVRHTPGGNR